MASTLSVWALVSVGCHKGESIFEDQSDEKMQEMDSRQTGSSKLFENRTNELQLDSDVINMNY